MEPIRFIHAFDPLPAWRRPPHARVVRIDLLDEKKKYRGEFTAIDAIMTVLYNHSIDDLKAFLDPGITTFSFGALEDAEQSFFISRVNFDVTVSYMYFEDGGPRDFKANYSGDDNLRKWTFVGGESYAEDERPSPMNGSVMAEFSRSVYKKRVWEIPDASCTYSTRGEFAPGGKSFIE